MTAQGPRERGLSFSTELVPKLLDGSKTMTRRVIPPIRLDGGCVGEMLAIWPLPNNSAGWGCKYLYGIPPKADGTAVSPIRCPYGVVGDRFWIKETWRVGGWQQDKCTIAVDYKAGKCTRREWLTVPDSDMFNRLWVQSMDEARRVYGERDHYEWEAGDSPCHWRPGRFMPKWAARPDRFEITEIWAEGLQKIHRGDCQREGVELLADRCICCHRDAFHALWDRLHAKRGYSWDSNPWVWVIGFRRIDDEHTTAL